MDTAHFDMEIVGSKYDIYKASIIEPEKFTEDFAFICNKYDFSNASKITFDLIQKMADNLVIILTKIRKAYVFDTYAPDSDFVFRINRCIKKAKDIKEYLIKKKHPGTKISHLTCGMKESLGKLMASFERVKNAVGKIIDTNCNNIIYSKDSWPTKSVLVGTLRNSKQLSVAVKHRFYHIPKSLVEAPEDIKCIAVYQSKNLFNNDCGVKYYGRVLAYTETERRQIKEIPSDSDEIYIRFEIEEWKTLKHPLIADYLGDTCIFTTLFQLINSEKTSELLLSNWEEFNIYEFMKDSTFTPGTEVLSLDQNSVIHTQDGFEIFKNEKLILKISNDRFLKSGVSAVKLISGS